MGEFRVYTYGASGSPAAMPSICFPTLDELTGALSAETAPFVLVVSAEVIQHVDVSYLQSLDEPADLIHAGLKTGMNNIFADLPVTALSWFFLNPDHNLASVSWKADPQCFFVNTEAYRAVGGINRNFISWEARVADLAYRLLRAGGKVFHDPGMIKEGSPWSQKQAPQIDGFRFVSDHINTLASFFYLLYRVRQGNGLIQSFRDFNAVRKHNAPRLKRTHIWSQLSKKRLKSVKIYSAIIPTIDRYDYLPAAVESLFNQEFPPDDVVVYDQTPLERRNVAWHQQFPQDKLKVIFSDTPGQSTARNEALKHTRHEWCLLFDDDSLALSDMSKKHIDLIENSSFFVSTGASIAPGQTLKDMPYDVDYYHLTDVLDTGNCFLHKSIWQKAGGFDPAFNRGPGADNDFGTRLYLQGVPIVFNNKAIRIHYKAKTGGLRNYGVWWRFKTSFRDPYPPPSQTYTIMKYYDKKFWSFMFLRFFIKASYRQSLFHVTALWLLYPFKLGASKKRAKALFNGKGQ